MAVIDPFSFEVDEESTYVQINGYPRGISSIAHPLVEDNSEWEGHANQSLDSDDDSRLEVLCASRGRWYRSVIETDDEELVDALEKEGHDPLTASEFADVLDDAPEFIYLRTSVEKSASRARGIKHVSTVEVDEIIELERGGE